MKRLATRLHARLYRAPAWSLNLRADPDAWLQVGPQKLHVRARWTAGQERQALWGQLTAANRYLPGVAHKAQRELPVIVLTPNRRITARTHSGVVATTDSRAVETAVVARVPSRDARPMTTQQDISPSLEQELHELEDSSDALDQRTGNLELRSGFVVLFVFFALAVSVAALVVSLVGTGKTNTRTVVEQVRATAPAPAAATPAVSPPGTVAVKLGEMFVRPNVTQVAAGKVTFTVQNTGKLVHEMIVAKAPVAVPTGGGKASEKNSVGEVAELTPGTSGTTKISLKPGKYILFCNVPGHYAAGQKAAFTVTNG